MCSDFIYLFIYLLIYLFIFIFLFYLFYCFLEHAQAGRGGLGGWREFLAGFALSVEADRGLDPMTLGS